MKECSSKVNYKTKEQKLQVEQQAIAKGLSVSSYLLMLALDDGEKRKNEKIN